jgi:hypothetical protein
VSPRNLVISQMNGIDASVGNAYYRDDRGFSPTMNRLLTFVATDTISQVLTEFWPDLKRKYFRKKDNPSAVTPELKSSAAETQ